MKKATVTKDFGDYKKGDQTVDPVEIEKLCATHPNRIVISDIPSPNEFATTEVIS